MDPYRRIGIFGWTRKHACSIIHCTIHVGNWDLFLNEKLMMRSEYIVKADVMLLQHSLTCIGYLYKSSSFPYNRAPAAMDGPPKFSVYEECSLLDLGSDQYCASIISVRNDTYLTFGFLDPSLLHVRLRHPGSRVQASSAYL